MNPRLLVVAAAGLWGTTGTTQALGPDDADPTAVGAVRLVVGGAVLAVLAWRRGWLADAPGEPGHPPKMSFEDTEERIAHLSALKGRGGRWRGGRWPVAATGGAALAIAAYQPLFFGGVDRTGVAVGTVVGIGSAPVVAGVLGRVVRDERLGRTWLTATTLALAGVALLLGRGDAADVDTLGIALAVGAGVSYAVYVLCTKTLLDHHRPEVVVVVTFALAAALLVPVAVLAGVGPLLNPPGVAVAAWLGLATVAVAYLVFARGLAGVGVGAAGTLTVAEPATAATLGVVVLGERLSPAAAVGVALIAAGLVILALGGRRLPWPAPRRFVR